MEEMKRKKITTDTRHILRHFKRVDPKLYAVLRTMKLNPLQSERGADRYFFKLCRDIISQQLGGKAADTIFGRFLSLFPDGLTPERVIEMPEEKIRAIGVSAAKARYIRNLAESVIAGTVVLDSIHEREDEEIIEELTRVKGIGRWTAEMFLIFTLGREDVFSPGDLGVAKGLALLYGASKTRSQKSVEVVTKPWAPYRSYGCLALWHAVDSKVKIS